MIDLLDKTENNTNSNLGKYKDVFLTICKAIISTKQSSVEKQHLTNELLLVSENLKHVIDIVIDDLHNMGYLKSKKLMGKRYISITKRGALTLEGLSSKLTH